MDKKRINSPVRAFFSACLLLVTLIPVIAGPKSKTEQNDLYKSITVNGATWYIDSSGYVFVDSQHNKTSDQDNTEWQYTNSLDFPRAQHQLFRLDEGEVLMIGGYARDPNAEPGTNPNFHPAEGKIYNTANGTWETGPSLNSGRSNFSGVQLENGSIVLAGGADLYEVHNNLEIINPETGESFLSSDMYVTRRNISAIELDDGRILVAGGTDGNNNFFNCAEIYDSATDTWEMTDNTFNLPRGGGKLVKLNDGRVLHIGGVGNLITSDEVDIFDPATNEWTSAPPMNKERQQFSVIKMQDGRIMVIGGLSIQRTSFFQCYEIFDPEENTWSVTTGLNDPRSEAAVVLLPDGDIFIAGGLGKRSTEKYCQQKKTWEPLAPMNQYRSRFDMILMDNGELLAVAGSYGWNDVCESAEVFSVYSGYLQAESTALDFGEINPGETSETDLKLTNEGFAWVEILDYSFSSPDFSFSQELPQYVFAHEELTAGIFYSGSLSTGFFEETLTLAIDQGHGPEEMEVSLTGIISEPTNILPVSQPNAGIHVFPNPSAGPLHIHSHTNISEVFVTDVTGNILLWQDARNARELVLETDRLYKGVYFIMIRTSEGMFVEKWIMSG